MKFQKVVINDVSDSYQQIYVFAHIICNHAVFCLDYETILIQKLIPQPLNVVHTVFPKHHLQSRYVRTRRFDAGGALRVGIDV